MSTQTDPQEELPLTETTFLILLSLAPEPKHGYAIMKDVAALSEDRINLSTGTLYGALSRLLERGWIARIEDDDAQDTGRPRKAYELTGPGRHILDAEMARLQALVSVARLRLVEGQA